jgi:hypothetical protein
MPEARAGVDNTTPQTSAMSERLKIWVTFAVTEAKRCDRALRSRDRIPEFRHW